jgi:hypothetical protein
VDKSLILRPDQILATHSWGLGAGIDDFGFVIYAFRVSSFVLHDSVSQ